MKQVVAVLLSLGILFSFVGCKEKAEQEEERVTLYLVTSQKSYTDGVLTDETTFTYDEKGRPLSIEHKDRNDIITKSEIAYDEHGNRISETDTWIYPGINEISPIGWGYEFSYRGDRAISCNRVSEDGSYGMSLQYDKAGRLVLVDYDESYMEGMSYDWHSFTYDKEGRLIADTQCTRIPEDRDQYRYSLHQIQYTYDEQGNLVEHCFASAKSEEPISPEEAAGMEYRQSPVHHYFFYYNMEGKLERVEDVNGNTVTERADVYDNPNYTFDEHGNLVSIESGKTRKEYTYTAIEVTVSEAEMAKRLMHGISEIFELRSEKATMDPLYWELVPPALYTVYLKCPAYYLVPHPLWQMDL